MDRYYYRIERERLNRGRPVTISSGLYKGCLEVHVCQHGVDKPDAIPIAMQRDIPWEHEIRPYVLQGSLVTIGFPGGEETFHVVTDYKTCDGHCVVMEPHKDGIDCSVV